MPVLTPVELWQATGRDKIPELFHVTDRNGRHFILPLTHEETFTFHAREIRSYKELPQLWYHFAVKDRDEPRPRGGLLRVREFIMKDAYSFDRDEESAVASVRAQPRRVPPDLRPLRHRGARGQGRERDHGRRADDRLPRAVGLRREHARPLRARRLRGRRGDRAGRPARARVPAAARRARGGRDARRRRRARRSRSSSASTWPRPRRRCRSRPRTGASCSHSSAATTASRESKLLSALKIGSRPSTDEEIRAAFGASRRLARARSGSTGEVVADLTLREGQFVAGANRDGFHLRGVEAGRDYAAALRRPPRAARGRPLPGLRRRAHLRDRDRGRPHLLLRRQVQLRPRRDVPRRGRPGEAAARRQLRHRPGAHNRGGGRAAAHDEDGIAAGRIDRAIRCPRDRAARGRGDRAEAAEALSAAGRSVLLDDRDAARRREVRRRRPDRHPGPGHGRQEERSRTGRSTSATARPRKRGAWLSQELTVMPKKRRFSEEQFGADGRAADGRDRDDLPRPGREDRALRRATSTTSSTAPVRCRRTTCREAGEGPVRRAGALPRVPDPCHHRRAREDAGPRRPPLPPPRGRRSLTLSRAPAAGRPRRL